MLQPLKKVLRLLPVFLSIAVVIGCSPRENEAQKAPSILRIQADNQRPDAFTTSVKVNVYCDLNWSADLSDKSWAKIENLVRNEGTGGSFTLTLSPNTDKGTRENVIKVTAGTGETSVTITQEGLDAFFQPSVIILSGTSSSSVKFTAPYDWTAEIASGEDWIVLPTSGGKAGASVLTCNARDENRNVGSREGSIRVRIGTASAEIPVLQGQQDVILGDRTAVMLDWEGGAFTVHTQSNVDYEISCDEDWIEHTETRSLNKAAEMFFAKPNETDDERFCTISFKGGNDVRLSVYVFQNARDTFLDLTRPGIYAKGETAFVYGEDGWNQIGRKELPDGSISFRLMNRASLSVYSVEGVPVSATTGSRFNVTLRLQTKERIMLQETLSASVIGTSEELIWIQAESGLRFIIKK